MRRDLVPSRRIALRWLAAAGGMALGARARAMAATAMAAEPFPDGVTLLAASTSGGPMDLWAATLTPILEHFLPPHTRIGTETAIGNDGVTGANQFAARTIPDGATVLLVPGAAALAWLVGDQRVHFDAASWVPVMAGLAPAVLVGRIGLPALRTEQGLRIAAAGPAGPDLPALLALEVLGCGFTPIFGLGEAGRAREALTEGAADLLLLHGESVPERVRALAGAGITPLFSLGALDAAGHRVRDPLLPDVPCLHEASLSLRGHPPLGPLAPACDAAAAAAALNFALVLPALTPPDIVGLWRSMGAHMAEAPTVHALSGAEAVRIQASPAANVATVAVAADAATLLSLRDWLASRFGWHSG